MHGMSAVRVVRTHAPWPTEPKQVGAIIPTHRGHGSSVPQSRTPASAPPASMPLTARSNTVDTVILCYCNTALLQCLNRSPGPARRMWSRAACLPRGVMPRGQARTGRRRRRGRTALRPCAPGPTVPLTGRLPWLQPGFHGPREARPAPVTRSSDARTSCRHAATTCGNKAAAGIMP
jgi:hypothetical protein